MVTGGGGWAPGGPGVEALARLDGARVTEGEPASSGCGGGALW
jgi:hypothetical protein